MLGKLFKILSVKYLNSFIYKIWMWNFVQRWHSIEQTFDGGTLHLFYVCQTNKCSHVVYLFLTRNFTAPLLNILKTNPFFITIQLQSHHNHIIIPYNPTTKLHNNYTTFILQSQHNPSITHLQLALIIARNCLSIHQIFI